MSRSLSLRCWRSALAAGRGRRCPRMGRVGRTAAADGSIGAPASAVVAAWWPSAGGRCDGYAGAGDAAAAAAGADCGDGGWRP